MEKDAAEGGSRINMRWSMTQCATLTNYSHEFSISSSGKGNLSHIAN
jgi:hypothetical protein